MTSSLLSPNSSSLTSNLSRKIHKFDSFRSNNQNPSLFSNGFLKIRISRNNLSLNSRLGSSRLVTFCSIDSVKSSGAESMKSSDFLETENEGGNGFFLEDDGDQNKLNVEVGNPNLPTYVSPVKLSLNDQVFFLLTFIACTTSVAFTSLVVAAVPTLYAMGRAAISLSKLADTAREELPSTMAAIRLSGMEISDLTLELSDLSQEIAEGVNKSAQAVQAAEAGIRQIGDLARQQTISMIQERANLPVISTQTVVAGAAKKTSRAVGQATKTLMNMISRGEFSSDHEDHGNDRIKL